MRKVTLYVPHAIAQLLTSRRAPSLGTRQVSGKIHVIPIVAWWDLFKVQSAIVTIIVQRIVSLMKHSSTNCRKKKGHTPKMLEFTLSAMLSLWEYFPLYAFQDRIG